LLSLLVYEPVFSQYILNGSAQKNSCNCYTLTPATQTQSGSVWNSNKINLSTSFDYWFNVNLGCSDANGADGIVFILQPISTSIGSTGEGMGFGGVSPSIGIALDTWQNTNLNDPTYDHISIQANGNINHSGDLAGPIQISATSDNVEDCNWHQLRITWDASTHWLRTYFDGVLRLEKQTDLVAGIFNGDPNVYWGFTGATGGSVNLQQFCTALDPVINTNAGNNTACKDSAVNFSSSSVSFAPVVNYNWSFGDGVTSILQNPPPHIYNTAGTYQVKLKIKGLDGCENETEKTLVIASPPIASLAVYDTCFLKLPRLRFDTATVGVSFQWKLDGGAATNSLPSLSNLTVGSHALELAAASLYNCGISASAVADFIIKPAPQIQAQVVDGCVNTDIQFTGLQLDAATTITGWNWNFGDGQKAFTQNARYSYSKKGNYRIALSAMASNGCNSDTAFQAVKINAASASSGNDTTVMSGYPFRLTGTGNGNFLWSPPLYLSNPMVSNPDATLNSDQSYVLTVTTPEGCIANDTLSIKVFTGPAIYVPTAFTPNGDGRNEVLLPVYVGIKELKQFAVFNRWGQLMFQTKDTGKGWGAKDAPAGTYVWFINAINLLSQPMVLKGTITLIR
jgi:gliding motility-associated-like protein